MTAATLMNRFMLAQKQAKPWAYMTSCVVSFWSQCTRPYRTHHSYGRINGIHCAENPTLLQDILRKEWGFDGLVTSDWHVCYYSTF